MKVESRIEALEQELKILKNEIQSTLLEIREQVLNHYYPELRAEEPPRGQEFGPKAAKGKSNNLRTPPPAPAVGPKGGTQPFSDVFLEDMADDEEPEDNGSKNKYVQDDIEDDDTHEMAARSTVATPQTREVAYQQIKQSAAPKVKPTAAREKDEAPSQKPNRPNFAALAAWVGNSVAKVGKERTNQVVATYAESGGFLSDEVKRSIQQLISLAGDEEPTNPIGSQEMLERMVELDTLLAKQ